MPAIERQGQRPAHAGIIERLSLVSGGDDKRAFPIARLHHNLVAERADQLVYRRWREAAELDRRTIAAERRTPRRPLVGINPGDSVERRQTRRIIIGVACSLDRLASLVFDKLEWAGAE